VAAHVDITQHIPFSKFLDMFDRTPWTRGQSIVGHVFNTTQHKQRHRQYRHTYLEYDLNPRYQCSSGGRGYIPQTAIDHP